MRYAAFVAAILTLSAWGFAQPAAATRTEDSPRPRRPFDPSIDGRWVGAGVCYGPFRDGQAPGAAQPTKEQIREDLRIIARHWNMLRMYGAQGATELVCEIIEEDKLPLRVLVGAWIGQEVRENENKQIVQVPEVVRENELEVATAIRLANRYPNVVTGVSVGNEALVSWSAHRIPPSTLIRYLKHTRAQVTVPVTTCDDFSFWETPESVDVARECDFLSVHIYAMWNKQTLTNAMDWSRATLAEVKAMHPGEPVVITEIGWATRKGTEGYQAIGVVAVPNEQDQELFYRALRHWATEASQPYFYFSAFDENWKGGASPDEIEKHWGVYNADRTPKRAVRRDQVP